MKVRFADYDGPTGLVIATGFAVLSLRSLDGAREFAVAAAQSGTTVPLSREKSAHALGDKDTAPSPGRGHPS